jgi:hypothetical protein
MRILILRGTEANRTSDRISKLVRRHWGRNADWFIEHYDGFTLVTDKPYVVRRDVGYDELTETLSA